MFSPDGTLISASAAPHCGMTRDTLTVVVSGTQHDRLPTVTVHCTQRRFTAHCCNYGKFFSVQPSNTCNRPCRVFQQNVAVEAKPKQLHARRGPSPCADLSLLQSSPSGFTFTWRGCYGLCQRNKPAELSHSFFILFFCLSLSLQPFRYIFSKVSLSPDIIPSGWLGSKHQLTN